jgi:predicted ester cyclase
MLVVERDIPLSAKREKGGQEMPRRWIGSEPAGSEQEEGGQTMAAEENKAVVQRYNELFVECWTTGEVDVLDEVLAPEFVYHSPGAPPDLSGFKQSFLMLRAAFPDMRGTVEDLFAEGDKVADRITWQATHQGELMGIAPTGNTVTGTEMHISRIAGGKIVERWGQGDNLGMMQQLGAIPAPGQGES